MAPKSARGRKRQTKISFSPATKTSSSTRSSTAAKMGNAPSQIEDCTSTTSKTRGSTRAAQPPRLDSSSEDELAGNMKAGNTRLGKKLHTPIKREENGMFGSSDVLSARSETEGEQEKIRPQAKPLSRKRQRTVSDSEPDHDRSAVTILPRKKKRIIEVCEASSEEEDQVDRDEQEEVEEEQEDEDEGEEVEEMPKARTRREVRRQRTPDNTVEVQIQSRSARRLARRPSPASDEDDVLVLPRSRRAKPAAIQTPSDEESEARTPPKNSRRRIRRRASESASEDQAAEDGGTEAQSDDDDEERNELKEDLAFLKSSPPQDRGRLRSVHGKPKNERQKALEALKRKRAGTTEPPSSATPNRKKPVVVETDSDSELEVIKEEPESDGLIGDEIDDDDDELEFDEHEPNALDIFQEGEDDIGFIDDNADALIGEPTADADLDDMRLAFSLSRAKTKDLFKHAVEWMVMKKIHPAFDSTRNFYTLTFRKLDDEVKGLAGSKFTSSAWTSEFTRAVRARPDLMANEIGGAADYMSPHCAACNRKNHPATWELMLTGQPYDKDTLEPLENDTSSDSDSDSDSSSLSATPPRNTDKEKPEHDASGEVLPPESHRFFLGSTCKANAQVSHTLYHWRYHLYQWVKQYLAQQGHLTPEKLVKRDKSSNRKREKAAIKIVDKMEADGEIRKLWRLYKEQVTFAVEAVNEFKDGWGRRGR